MCVFLSPPSFVSLFTLKTRERREKNRGKAREEKTPHPTTLPSLSNNRKVRTEPHRRGEGSTTACTLKRHFEWICSRAELNTLATETQFAQPQCNQRSERRYINTPNKQTNRGGRNCRHNASKLYGMRLIDSWLDALVC